MPSAEYARALLFLAGFKKISGYGLAAHPPSEFVEVTSSMPLTGTPTAWGVRWPAKPLASKAAGR
jgi:hypothetical protein